MWKKQLDAYICCNASSGKIKWGAKVAHFNESCRYTRNFIQEVCAPPKLFNVPSTGRTCQTPLPLANRIKKQPRYFSDARNVVLYYFGTWRAERTRFITTRPRSFSPILPVFLPFSFLLFLLPFFSFLSFKNR